MGIVLFVAVIAGLTLLVSLPSLIRKRQRRARYNRSTLNLTAATSLPPTQVRRLAAIAADSAGLKLVAELEGGGLYVSPTSGVEVQISVAAVETGSDLLVEPRHLIHTDGRPPKVRDIAQAIAELSTALRAADPTATILTI